MDLGAIDIASRRGSRMVSSSPLGRKGASVGKISQLDIPGYTQIGVDDELTHLLPASSDVGGSSPGSSEHSEAIIAALDQDSQNFLDFVTRDIKSLGVEKQNDHDTTFAKLLPPGGYNEHVAAQAFLHVLTLATKGLIDVEQDQDSNDIIIKIAEEL